jgi:hypothetical protein
MAMAAIRAVIQRFIPQPDTAREFFYRLVAGGRYMQDIYTTYAGPDRDTPAWHASDLVLHNSAVQGYWLAINRKVYDVTDFVHLHPGGARVLVDNAGMDATDAYEGIGHHLNTAVEAMLGMFQIGAIQHLQFRGRGGLAVERQGLTYVSVEDAFRHWVRFLYSIVEHENALRNYFGFRLMTTTLGEDPSAQTNLKLQMVVEVHCLFMDEYRVPEESHRRRPSDPVGDYQRFDRCGRGCPLDAPRHRFRGGLGRGPPL